ncbi:MAG: hypothetical protein ACKVS8_03580 [Phycisphaerales bacterium]
MAEAATLWASANALPTTPIHVPRRRPPAPPAPQEYANLARLLEAVRLSGVCSMLVTRENIDSSEGMPEPPPPAPASP